MRRASLPLTVLAAATLTLSGCATGAVDAAGATADGSADGAFPVTIEHALGKTTIPAKPKRVATIAWGSQDVALALGVVPVGMDAQVWSWEGASAPGVYEWTQDKIDELGGDQPVIFDTTDGVDFEAIADTDPDVILATQSGLSADDYATLDDVAPVVSYPGAPWVTPWRDQITIGAEALGLKSEGDKLVSDIEDQIATATADAGFGGKTAAFFYATPSDLSKLTIYTAGDPRTAVLQDLGFDLPQVAIDAAKTGSFSQEISAENVDKLDDVDVIVAYGDDTLLPALQADPLWSTLPAVKNGAVVAVGNGDAFSAAVSPTALSLPWVLDDYVTALKDSAAKVQ